MNRANSPISAQRTLQILWFGMAGSVILLGVALLVIDQALPRFPMSEELDMALKGLGLVSLAPFFIFRELYSARPVSGGKPADPVQAGQRAMVRLLVGASLAEAPLVIMLAYVAIGGAVIWGVLAWISSFLMLLTIRPEAGRTI